MPEFNNLIDTRTHIEDKFTPAGGADTLLISAEDLRKASAGLQEFIVDRGVKVINNATAFATSSGADTKLIFLKNFGLFQYQASGVVSPPFVQAAAGGGVYQCIFRSNEPDEVGYATNGTYTLQGRRCLMSIMVLPGSPIQFRLGTTPNGEELVPEVTISDTGDSKLLCFWPPLTTTLYISGITSFTSIYFLIQ